jgi:hypothetical protein
MPSMCCNQYIPKCILLYVSLNLPYLNRLKILCHLEIEDSNLKWIGYTN